MSDRRQSDPDDARDPETGAAEVPARTQDRSSNERTGRGGGMIGEADQSEAEPQREKSGRREPGID